MQITFPASQLKRFKDLGFFLFKYGNPETVSQLGITEVLLPDSFTKNGSEHDSNFSGQQLDELCADLEKAGPTFVRIAQHLASGDCMLGFHLI